MKASILFSLAIACCSAYAGAATPDAGVSWGKDIDTAIKTSKQSHQLVYVDFYADWCGPCKQMEKTTYTDPRVIRQLKKFESVKIDIEKEQALAKKYGGNAVKYRGEGIPASMIIDADGKVLNKAHGYLSADELLALLASVDKKTKP